MHDNVFWDFELHAMKPRHIDDSDYYRNINISCANWLSMTSTAFRNTIRRNVFINSGLAAPSATYPSTNDIAHNAYYYSRYYDLIFTARRITAPLQVTIPNGKVTASSPHASWFGL